MKILICSLLSLILGILLGHFTRSFSDLGTISELDGEQLTLIANRFTDDEKAPKISLALHKRLDAEIDGISENQKFTASFAGAWASEDPAGGLKWSSYSDSQERSKRRIFIYEWTRQSPSAVEAHLRSLPVSGELYFGVFDNWIAFHDDEIVGRALAWYDSQSDELKEVIISQITDTVMVHDPGGVLKWLLQQESIDESANPMWENDHHRALDIWLKRDEDLARKWLFDEADPVVRDQLLADLGYSHSDYFSPMPSRHLLNENRYSVYELQAQIVDPDLRWKSLCRTMSLQGSYSGQKSLDASELQPAMRAKLQELIDTGKTNDARKSD